MKESVSKIMDCLNLNYPTKITHKKKDDDEDRNKDEEVDENDDDEEENFKMMNGEKDNS